MPAVVPTPRRRPVSLTPNENLVALAKTYTNNLSATMGVLLTGFDSQQQQAQHGRQKMDKSCVADWNAVHDQVDSYTDEHIRL